ncbi:aldolase [Niallia sp. 01092]|uniref:aldolase n=1 Tax=unclassified Niallia TaxID=2837522 RepID=UPI003FD68B5C
MIGTARKGFYKAFGLVMVSDIILPELPLCNENEHQFDLIISIKDLSDLWASVSSDASSHVIAKENFVIFEVPDTAIFCIRDGKEIIVSPIKESAEDKIRLYILGTCMGAVLLQRKIITLHGSCIAINGKAYAFIGESGAGKSTLASAFLKENYALLSDDVIAVSFSENQIPLAFPSYPQQKLWEESLNQFGMESNHYQPLFERETKFAVPVPSRFGVNPLPLAGIFEIAKTENEDIKVKQIKNLERFPILYRHTYRSFLIQRLNLIDWHFMSTAKMLSHINLYKIERPVSRFTANELVPLILKIINKEL